MLPYPLEERYSEVKKSIMTHSKKTKIELYAEVKKLQHKIELLENRKDTKIKKQEPRILKNADLMSFLNHSKNSIVLIDINGNILDVNKVGKTFQKENIIGSNVFLFITEESKKIVKEAIASVFKTQKPEIYGSSIMTKEAGLIYFSSVITPIIENKQVIAALIEAEDITEEIKIHNKLKDSEAKFRKLAQNATDIIFRYSVYPERKLEYMSPSFEKITGYSLEEFYKDPHLGFKIIHPDDLHIIETLQKQNPTETAAANYKNNSRVLRWIRKDGRIIWTETIDTPILDKEDKLIAVEGISRDITERKLYEQKLIESENRFKELIEGSTELIQSVGIDGKFLYVNKIWKETLGYTDDEVVKFELFDIMDEEFLDQCKAELEEVLNGKTLKNIQVVFKSKTGQKIFLEGNVIPRYLNGKVIGTQAFFENIADRIKMEVLVKAKEQNTLLARHAELVPGLIFQYQIFPDGRFMFPFASKKIWDIFEVTPEEVKKDASLAFSRLHLDDSENVVLSIKQSMKTLKEWSSEFRVNLPGRGTIWISGHAKPEKLSDGSLIWHGYISDITEAKIVTEQINQSLQEKEILLKEVHHRVKNNLQVISSILNLQSSYVKDEATLNVLRESQNRIKSMAFIHESLYQADNFSNINFSDYVVNLLQNLMQSYSKLNQTVKLNVDLQTVFLNLDTAIPCGLIINEIISNALKYAFADNKEGDEITIMMKMEGKNIKLAVGDNGVGLPQNIDYRNTESLGLQLVVTLVGQLNGSVALDNTNGTKYTIQFAK